MSGYRVSLSLALVCLWLCCAALAQGPCQSFRSMEAYEIFEGKHFAPLNSAMTFEQLAATRPKEPAQSFLNRNDENDVKSVCSPRGGKVYQGNQCISNRLFTITTVKGAVINNKFEVSSVDADDRYLIVSCANVDVSIGTKRRPGKRATKCLPVHFQSNNNNASPDPGAGGCGA